MLSLENIFFDFWNDKVTGDEKRHEKKNKIIKRVQKEKQRRNGFRHATSNAGRGRNSSLKQLKVRDENSNITKTCHDRYEI